MKKLLELLKTKERGDKNSAPDKKSPAKATHAPADRQNDEPRELFSDDYSDIGYC